STTPSCSWSIPATRRAGSCGSRAGGRERRSPPPPNWRGYELPNLPRLARADGARARAAVQALHRRRGSAPGRRAHADPRGAALGRGDLLRPRPQRLPRRPHGRAHRRRPALEPLVRGARVGGRREARAAALRDGPGGLVTWPVTLPGSWVASTEPEAVIARRECDEPFQGRGRTLATCDRGPRGPGERCRLRH